MSKWRKETLELAVQLVIIEGVRVAVACRGPRVRDRDRNYVLNHITDNCDMTGWQPLSDDDRYTVRNDNGGWLTFLIPGDEVNNEVAATHVVQIGLFGVQTMFDPADYGL